MPAKPIQDYLKSITKSREEIEKQINDELVRARKEGLSISNSPVIYWKIGVQVNGHVENFYLEGDRLRQFGKKIERRNLSGLIKKTHQMSYYPNCNRTEEDELYVGLFERLCGLDAHIEMSPEDIDRKN